MKRIGLFLATCLICMVASAQITWNVKAGAGLATARGDVENASGKLGWKIGVGLEKPLSSDWLIMPSFEFKQKGTQMSFSDEDESEKSKVTFSYLQLPILAAYRIRLSDEINLTAKAGPYVAYALSGKETYEYSGSYGSGKEEYDLFDSEEGVGQRFDAGLLLGVDVEYQRFVLGAEFEYGLLPAAKYEFEDQYESVSFKAYNTSFYITLGYKF